MKITSCVYTNPGGRRENEDTILAAEQGAYSLYAVCDGLGGHQNGKKASQLAAKALFDRLEKEGPRGQESLCEAFQEANLAVLTGQREPQCESMKSTGAALVLTQDTALWAHIGDSRLYCFREGALHLVTADHSVSYRKFRAGEITFDAMNKDEDRSSLLRVMGNPDGPGAEVCAAPMALMAGDAFLLCSDGFWEYLLCDEIGADLVKSQSPDQWLRYLLARHGERSRTDNDNFSAIAVMVGEG